MLLQAGNNEFQKTQKIAQIQAQSRKTNHYKPSDVDSDLQPLNNSGLLVAKHMGRSRRGSGSFHENGMKHEIDDRIKNMNQDEELIEAKVKLRKNKDRQDEYIDLDRVLVIKQHIVNHKLKSNFAWIQAKYYLDQWKEVTYQHKMGIEKKAQGIKSGLGNQLIKNEVFTQITERKTKRSLVRQSKKSRVSLTLEPIPKTEMKTENIEENKDQDQIFQMPNKDLLKYIPYCTDVYLGDD